MPSASIGEFTSISIGRVLASESTSNAIERSRLNWFQRLHSRLKLSEDIVAIKVANASFNQIPFHHSIVTRSPNHM